MTHVSRWRVLRDPRYLRFAVLGMILWGVAAAYWGQGNWPQIALWVGIGLILGASAERCFRRSSCGGSQRPACRRRG